MKRVLAVVVLMSTLLFAQTQPVASQQATPAQDPKPQTTATPPQTPTPPHAKPQSTPSTTEKRPLTELPYTPSLDLNAMDRAADPCVDFYQYTCGGWMKNNPIPPDQSTWSVYGKLANENQQFLWGILEQASKPSPNRTAVQQKIGDYFASCMDEARVEKLGASPLKPMLGRIAAVKSTRDFAPLLAELHVNSYTSGFLFGFGSNQDFGDATQVIAFADAGGLGLPDRDYYFKDDARTKEIREKYVKHIQRMFELLGDAPAQAAMNAQTVMKLETTLAGSHLTRVEQRNPYNLYHKMDRAKLKALTPSFDWDRYLDLTGIGNVGTFNVTQPKFFQTLEQQIKAVPLDDWKTFLRWHLVRSRAPYLSSAFVQADFDFYRKTLRGVSEISPRWKRCVNYVDRDLGEALGQEFVARTFSPQTKQRTLDMTQRIEKAMESEIEQLDWMSEATKKRALEKLHSMVNKIGYPDKWRDYSSVQIAREDFYGNATRATIFESRRQLGKIGKPLDRGEWGMTPPTVNAYYNPQMNDINFPAGVLQPPLFDPKMDDAPNYGNTGGTIGHELTHGFDDEGRQFDADGNLKDWWTPEDAKRFEEKVDCVREQYAQYVIVDDIKINSKLTSGEDVADIGGTLLAYLAWKDATEDQELKPVDGLTPDQRFFIGYAQWTCNNIRPEELRVRAVTDPHSPGKYRVNGVVVNIPEFQKAFGCKPGQPMYREKACKVW